MRVVSFKVEDDLLEMLDEYVNSFNTTKSEVIRRALREYLSRKMDRYVRTVVTRRMKIYPVPLPREEGGSGGRRL